MAEPQQAEHQVGHKNEKIGQVVSDKMNKTIVVEVTRRVPHPVYKRIISKRNKFYACVTSSRPPKSAMWCESSNAAP